MAITDWPAEERPRERLLARGAAVLSDAELLAIFLRVGIRGKSAVDLARDLLARFGGLTALFAAGEAEFASIPGMGSAKYAQLQAGRGTARKGPARFAACRARLAAPEARRPALRMLQRPPARRPEPADPCRRTVSRHARPDQRLSARSGQGRAGEERGGGDLRA